ncbi:TonB-dependent receptor [Brevundimonas sp.]|uniref:TonB-dependent receptor n=1 Tax=Brevundimonas sp. TaxID=1871086 RepID=UPI001A191B98|nr:TonB-dependent receptor [Brevundimonas sp.]MBJ7483316.1 TonB-dependent receptor [Brevundimonas sp.]
MSRTMRKAALFAGASLFWLPSLAMAQSVPVQPEPEVATGLEEVIVTAQRREERLQDVPVAVTAFSARELDRRQITDVRALTENAPSITFTATPYGNNDLILAIRGVAPGGVLPNVDQAVGTYVDGLYYARPEGSNFAMVDVASAEVLRGPQGTLFGRNTIGGALNITTNKPSYDFGGSLKLGYGNYNAITATGIVNLPLVDDKLAARLVYSHVEHEGYGYNPTLRSDVADQNDDFLRASVRADISPDLRVDLSFDHYSGSNHQPLWVLNSYQAGLSAAMYAPYVAASESRVSQAGYNPVNDSEVYDFTGTITAQLGSATLKSISAYRNVNFEGASDLDGTPIPTADVRIFELDGHQVSQELQLTGTAFADRLNWTTGAYYFREQIRNSPITRVPTAIQDNTIRPDNESMSVFAQLSYEILPRLRLTGGVRAVKDTRGMTYTPARFAVAGAALVAEPPATAVTPAACPFTAIGLNEAPGSCLYTPADIEFNTVPFTVGLDYRLPGDGLLFAKFSKGFRSGGFQQASGTTAAFYRPFDEESVASYEAGAKLTFFDNRLRMGLSGYFSTFEDIQQNAILSASPVIIAVLNSGTAEIYGGEFEATALLGDLRLNASLGLIHPEFTEGPYKGSEIPTVAKTTYSFSADYPIELEAGRLDLHADYNSRSEVFFLNTVSITGTGPVPLTDFQRRSISQEGYGLLNAQLSFTFANAPITLAAYGKNLTDEYFAARSGSFAAANFNSIVVGSPRTYGVSLHYAF